MRSYAVVRAAWDDEAKVWSVEDTDIAGLATEAATLDQLRAKVPVIVRDLLIDRDDVPDEIEIIACRGEHLTQAGLPKAF